MALSTFDPFCLKLVKDHLLGGAGERVVHVKLASDVTMAWIEEEFQTLSLFGDGDSFFIHQADALKADVLEAMGKLSLSNRFVVLSFDGEGAAWKKLVKANTMETLTIESPRFWEVNKLLDFVCRTLSLPLSFEAKNWMLDSLENDLGTFMNNCALLKLNYPEAREIGIEQVKELLTLEKLDQFQLASLFARKKFRDFFDRLISLEGDFDKMRFFFNFMQSHLVKMSDTSYLSGKPRLTQYDKDLQSTAKLWKGPDLLNEIDRFQRWELLCKKKDTGLWHELHQAQLRVLGAG